MSANAISNMISPEKIRIIYNGIDLDEIANSPIQRIFSPKHMILGRACRFGRGQNLPLLIFALEKLLPGFPDLRLTLVGSDSILQGAEPIYSELIQLVNELNLTKYIHFTGQLEDALPMINGFDIGTCVSNDEGLPNSLIEAMACRKPVVSSNVGAISELIRDGENGLLFPAGDIGAFCEKIEWLQEDKRRLDSLAKNAYQTINDLFNIKKNAFQYAELYREVLHR